MTNLRKILAVILAITMIMSLAVSVVATGGQQTYTLTVAGAYGGETYYAYKIFDSTYGSTNNAYSYTIDSTSDFFNAIYDASNESSNSLYGYLTLTQVGTSTTYVVEYDISAGNTGGSESDFLEKFKAVIELVIDLDSVSPTATTTASDGEAVFNDLYSGYYYVTTTAGSMVSIGNTPVSAGDGTVQEKNAEPTVTKEVYQGEDDPTSGTSSSIWGETNNAQVGDTVYFKTTINNIVNNITLYDSMEAGLNYKEIVSVYFYADSTDTTGTQLIDSSTVSAGDSTYTVVVDGVNSGEVYYKVSVDSTAYGNGTGYYTESDGVYSAAPETFYSDTTYYTKGTFSMTFDLADSATVGSESYIVVTYTATVNEEAEIYEDHNDNSTYVKFGTSLCSEPSKTQTYVYGFEIFKYTGTDTPLTGVKFTLSYVDVDGTTQYLVSENSSSPYTINAATIQVDNATEFETGSDGKIIINGLDSDKTYYLTETEALAGYNKLTGSVMINIIGVDGSDGTVGNVTYTYDSNTESNAEKVSVQNNTGTELPGTGGIGTTIFYVVGGILVVGAVVLLITKKRLGNKDE